MIGVDTQYMVQYTIGSHTDFLLEEDLITFTIIEEAGNVLPTFELAFHLHDDLILRELNEGNVIEYKFGDTKVNMTTTNLRILKKHVRKFGKHKYQVYLAGLYDEMSYTSPCSIRALIAGGLIETSGMRAMESMVSPRFNWKSNRQDSPERQIWIQYNIPDKKFVNQIWMHIDLPNSFPVIGINTKGDFIFKDFEIEVSRRDYDWIFQPRPPTSPPEVMYDGDYEVSSNTGFINHWLGYEITKSMRTLETADDSDISPTIRPMIVSSRLDRSALISDRVAPFGVRNDNVHGRYWEAYYQNLSHLAVYSSTRILLNYYEQMKPSMSILDYVYFEDEIPKTEKQMEDDYSGYYLITKISRTIAIKSIVTTVELSREAFAELQGKLK